MEQSVFNRVPLVYGKDMRLKVKCSPYPECTDFNDNRCAHGDAVIFSDSEYGDFDWCCTEVSTALYDHSRCNLISFINFKETSLMGIRRFLEVIK